MRTVVGAGAIVALALVVTGCACGETEVGAVADAGGVDASGGASGAHASGGASGAHASGGASGAHASGGASGASGGASGAHTSGGDSGAQLPPKEGGTPGPVDSGVGGTGAMDVARPDSARDDGSTADGAREGGTVPDAGSRDGMPPIGPVSDASLPDATAGDGSLDASADAPNPPDGSVSPVPTTPLTGSSITDGAKDVPRTTWVRLDFGTGLDPRAASGVTLDCGPATPGFDVDVFESTTFVVNPRAPLDPSASCTVAFQGPNGPQQIHFEVAAQGAPAVVPYDRNDAASFEPFPDDFFLVNDATTRTGRRVDIRVPEVEASLMTLFDAVLAPTRALDGMSPLAPIVVALPDVIDAQSIPKTAAASTDPFATIALFDVDSTSVRYRKRIPFDAIIRNEQNIDGSSAHNLVVFPSVPLSPRGRYAFVVSNRALVNPSRPLVASSFFDKVASGQATTVNELRLAPVLDDVLRELSGTSPPIRTDDVALALGISVRSDDDIPKDLSAIRAYVQSAAAPQFAVTSIGPDPTPGTDVAAIVEGTWSPPDWSSGDVFVDRDTTGTPTSAGLVTIGFTLALPKSAATTPAPIVVYQHGQPGNAPAEVPNAARRGLAKAGFATIGFTDVANRDVIPNGDIVELNIQALVTLLTDHDLPDYLSLLSHADQLSFLKMIPTLGALDVLPIGSPDGLPDLNASGSIGYLGISQGAVHGIGLMAFAPEVHAAALVAGAGRFGATLVHQSSEPLYQGVGGLFTTMTRGQFYAGIAAVQMDFDRQDPQNLARFVYRAPLALGSSARASILMTEGLGDSLVPFYATRSGASQLGLVQLEPHAVAVPFLPTALGPLQGNVDSTTTSAFFQFVPDGFVGAPPTPGCVSVGQTEGHYCAQTAAEAVRQRITFFTSHANGVPVIIDPFQ